MIQIGSLRSFTCVLIWFNKQGTLAESSGMNTTSFLGNVQVSPCEAGIMSKAIIFWRTVFLIRDISVFSKDRLCQLSFKTWVNLVRTTVYAIMSSRPIEGIKTAAKRSYNRMCLSHDWTPQKQRNFNVKKTDIQYKLVWGGLPLL